ncbi:anti-sigma factor [Paraburkholderia sp. Ac-20336]|uniref:anti-sigma factor family protein n=1 Tax=unclassified Paraburkholderia TaxID=2615204 RepID=UPI00198082E5|nr:MULTISPECIES: zf-HC2 domain-containing protein [unclassified Paraburkholderia]MBN3804988.1 anti-sigma factor [Paraburkholderia sp. Ac-20336]MBN3848216.1 anti-sigma factor [Paraburkholderia sp. Ac-20342]
MNCNEARPLLDANADHELPAPDARRVQQHIESCDDCRRASENLRALRGALRAAPYHRAPSSLRARIVAGLPAALDEGRGVADRVEAGAQMGEGMPADGAANAPNAPNAAKEPRRRRGVAWWSAWLDGLLGSAGSGGRGHTGGWSGPGGSGSADGWGGFGRPATAGGVNRVAVRGGLVALAIALCAAAAILTLNLHRPADAQFSPFIDELVESHVRAQVSGRDIDVISTDRHTVKPWFNGRLDYSPPVEDLAASGFALEGGRLDYIAHQRVAVLVYRYRKHVIDVYVFPQGAARGADGAMAAVLGHDGYSIAHWDAQGMTWWAISDAAPDALSGLEAALKARLQSGSESTEAG